MDKQDYLLILNAISGLGPARIKQLLKYFPFPENIFRSSSSEIKALGIPPLVAEGIFSFDRDQFIKSERKLIEENKIKIVSFLDQDYPKNLFEIDGAPVVLYIKGQLKKEHSTSIAVVGSRRSSFYGISMAEKFSYELAQLGITVVSGMARGIDSAAHRSAIKGKGETLAVLGSGLLQIYPPENKNLFRDISLSGAVISEFPLLALPLPGNFPRRNRIISGLSLGVLVVEANKRSGALITADFALEQGREVFAVPGKVDHPNSRGVHQLIKQGAKLVGSIEDILEELKLPLKDSLRQEENLAEKNIDACLADLTDEEKIIFKNISEKALHVDEITASCRLPVSKVISALFAMELKKKVKQLPGKRFKRLESQKG